MSNKPKLTEEAYQKFFQWLDPDPAQAELKFQAMRNRVVQDLQQLGCPEEDAKDLAAEALESFILRIIAGHEIHNPAGYLKISARNGYLQLLRKKRKEISWEELEEEGFNPFVTFVDEKAQEREEKLICLDRCLAQLPEEKRILIIEYYFPEAISQPQRHQQLSQTLELSPGNLRVQAFRLRKKLLTCLEECLNIPLPMK